MDDLMDKINLWGSDDNDYESEVSKDATTEATVLTTKAPSHTTEQDSRTGDDAGLAFNAFFMLLFVIIFIRLQGPPHYCVLFCSFKLPSLGQEVVRNQILGRNHR